MPKIIKLQGQKNGYKNIPEIKNSVLCGGFFDILHTGHVRFLKESKTYGDKLIVLLEGDRKAKSLKGARRPFFSLAERAFVLSQIRSVDFIILINKVLQDKDYLNLIMRLKPQVVTITEGDLMTEKKKVQAVKSGATVKIIRQYKSKSSSSIAKSLNLE